MLASALAHLAVAGGLFVAGVWRLERLEAPRLATRGIGIMEQPPAPSGGPVPPKPPKIERKHKPKPDKLVQLTKPPQEVPPAPKEDEPEGPGSGSGAPTDTGPCTENCGDPKGAAPVCGDGSVDPGEGCDDGNTANGDGCSSSCRREITPVPPVRAPVMAPTARLQALRISGDTQIRPSTTTQSMMLRAHDSTARGSVLVCIATDGSVSSASMKQSTSYAEYDEALLSGVRGWRYRPYQVNGEAVPACSIVTFVYTMQ